VSKDSLLAIKSAGVFSKHTVEIAKNAELALSMYVRIELLHMAQDLVVTTPISKETTDGCSNVLRHSMFLNLLLYYAQEQLYSVLYSTASKLVITSLLLVLVASAILESNSLEPWDVEYLLSLEMLVRKILNLFKLLVLNSLRVLAMKKVLKLKAYTMM